MSSSAPSAAERAIELALNDPNLSLWLRGALATAVRRDPTAAACDAQLLSRLLLARLAEAEPAAEQEPADWNEFPETVRMPL